jgi:meiotically up-regulated gene 157 (Mug157) protein
MKRRKFIINNSLALGALTMMPVNSFFSEPSSQVKNFISNRPPKEKRTFLSESVEKTILDIKSSIADKEIAWMFENCYPNTLDTTVDYEVINGKPDTFVITGDINAMWLRDSTAQVWPYTPVIMKDEKIKNLILGLINRQVKCVLTDPYANAFYKDLTKESEWKSDIPSPGAGVHERKWEIDSL